MTDSTEYMTIKVGPYEPPMLDAKFWRKAFGKPRPRSPRRTSSTCVNCYVGRHTKGTLCSVHKVEMENE